MTEFQTDIKPVRRDAPHEEWVEMYRRGITPSRIGAMDAASVTTVRYHLQIAKKIDPNLQSEHAAALPKSADPSNAVLQSIKDIVAFYWDRGQRLPSANAKSAHEATLGRWLSRRRREAREGTLSPAVRNGLEVIPGWELTSRRKTEDEARWQERLQQVKILREAGRDWPRHQKTQDTDERVLGVWLHGQRINFNQGKLAPEKELLLNEVLPGWREGRPRGGGRRRAPQGSNDR